MAVMEYLGKHFWSIFWGLVLISLFFGDPVREFFYAILNAVTGRRGRGRLSRKQEKALRATVEESRRQLAVATDILRDVEAADKSFPQLPQNTAIRIEAFLDRQLDRSALPDRRTRRADNS